jgi:hypothetical protein
LLLAARSSLAALLGAVAGAALASLLVSSAQATTKTASVLPGLTPDGDACSIHSQFEDVHRCWHDNESGAWSALDLNAWDGEDDGVPTYWKHWGADWSQVVSVWFDDIQNHTGTSCTGVYVQVTTSGVDAKFHYLHIEQDDVDNIADTTSQSWFSVPGYVEGSTYLGDTAHSQPGGCGFITGQTHLHQSGGNAAETDVYTNWDATESGCSGLCNWSLSTWVHQVRW